MKTELLRIRTLLPMLAQDIAISPGKRIEAEEEIKSLLNCMLDAPKRFATSVVLHKIDESRLVMNISNVLNIHTAVSRDEAVGKALAEARVKFPQHEIHVWTATEVDT